MLTAVLVTMTISMTDRQALPTYSQGSPMEVVACADEADRLQAQFDAEFEATATKGKRPTETKKFYCEPVEGDDSGSEEK